MHVKVCFLGFFYLKDLHLKFNFLGDSGGPIFLYDNPSGVSTVVGIVSFGVSCGTALPSVYTRVASYIEWIESNVWP